MSLTFVHVLGEGLRVANHRIKRKGGSTQNQVLDQSIRNHHLLVQIVLIQVNAVVLDQGLWDVGVHDQLVLAGQHFPGDKRVHFALVQEEIDFGPDLGLAFPGNRAAVFEDQHELVFVLEVRLGQLRESGQRCGLWGWLWGLG